MIREFEVGNSNGPDIVYYQSNRFQSDNIFVHYKDDEGRLYAYTDRVNNLYLPISLTLLVKVNS